MSNQAKFSMEVGIVLCGTIRKFLRDAKFAGMAKGYKVRNVPSMAPDTLVKPRVTKHWQTHEITKSVLRNYNTGEETEWVSE